LFETVTYVGRGRLAVSIEVARSGTMVCFRWPVGVSGRRGDEALGSSSLGVDWSRARALKI